MRFGNLVHQLAVGGSGGNLFNDIGLLVARLGFGTYMALSHGLGKIRNPSAMAPYLEALGLPLPTAMAWVAGVVEFFGAILLTIGLVTRPAATALAGAMCIAAFVAHQGDPWFLASGPKTREPAMLFLFAFVLFAFAGGGRFSVDRFLRKKT